MAKLIITVDQYICDGCEECVLSCPGEVLEILDGKAITVRIEDCQSCRICEQICPKKAIAISDV